MITVFEEDRRRVRLRVTSPIYSSLNGGHRWCLVVRNWLRPTGFVLCFSSNLISDFESVFNCYCLMSRLCNSFVGGGGGGKSVAFKNKRFARFLFLWHVFGVVFFSSLKLFFRALPLLVFRFRSKQKNNPVVMTTTANVIVLILKRHDYL